MHASRSRHIVCVDLALLSFLCLRVLLRPSFLLLLRRACLSCHDGSSRSVLTVDFVLALALALARALALVLAFTFCC